MPLELTFKIESNQIIPNFINFASEEDILFYSEPYFSPDYVTVRLTSYEKNVGNVILKCILISAYEMVFFFFFHLGKMYHLVSMCRKTYTVSPVVPLLWSEYETETSFRKF